MRALSITIVWLLASPGFAASLNETWVIQPPTIDYHTQCAAPSYAHSKDTLRARTEALLDGTLIDERHIQETIHALQKRSSAKNGNGARAAIALASLYRSGRDVPYNLEKADALIAHAKSILPAASWYAEGQWYEQKQNIQGAITAYRHAMSQGHIPASLALARLYQANTPDQTRTLMMLTQNMLLERLGRGDCSAALSIAKLYLTRRFGGYAPEAGLAWLTVASKAHQAQADLMLAEIYTNGVLAPTDHERAQTLYQRASDSGYAPAMHRYAERLAQEGATQQAMALYHTLTAQNDRDALRALIELYAQHDPLNPALRDLHETHIALAPRDGKAWFQFADYLHDQVADKEQVFRYYRKAALLGYEKAYRALGDRYRYSDDISTQTSRALSFYRYAATQSDANAADALAHHYRCSSHQEVLADRWQEISLLIHPPAPFEAMVRGANLQHIPMQQERVFFDYLRRLAWEKKDRKAMLLLSEMYRAGQGITEDTDTATSLQQLALREGPGQAEAYFYLYELSQSLPRVNETQLLRYVQRASELGHARATYELGTIHKDGRYGITANAEQAVRYYRIASEADLPSAMRAQARTLITSDAQPNPEAEALLKRAADLNDYRSMLALSEYYHALGQSEASRRYVILAERHAPCGRESQSHMMDAFLQGLGTDAQQQHAMQTLEAQENVDAQTAYQLAENYLLGRGVARNIHTAMQWYQRAAAQEYAPAQEALLRAEKLGFAQN